MNERIRALWKQAGGHYNSGNQHTWPEYTIDDPEKFALLIIRECARVAIAKQTENDIAGIVSKNPAKDFAYALVEQFGVEE